MKYIYILLFIFVCITAYDLWEDNDIDISYKADVVKDQLYVFKKMVESHPSSTRKKVKNLPLNKVYLASESPVLLALSPLQYLLDSFGDRKYLDSYQYPWRFLHTEGKLKVWSVGLNGIDENGNGDDHFVIINLE